MLTGEVNALQVSIGRLSDNSITLGDNEVSGHHVAICWEATCRSWQVCERRVCQFEDIACVESNGARELCEPSQRSGL